MIDRPLCLGPVEVTADKATCAPEQHSFATDELVRALQADADSALWAAIRALGARAPFARLRKQQGRTVPVEAPWRPSTSSVWRELLRSGVELPAHRSA